MTYFINNVNLFFHLGDNCVVKYKNKAYKYSHKLLFSYFYIYVYQPIIMLHQCIQILHYFSFVIGQWKCPYLDLTKPAAVHVESCSTLKRNSCTKVGSSSSWFFQHECMDVRNMLMSRRVSKKGEEVNNSMRNRRQ